MHNKKTRLVDGIFFTHRKKIKNKRKYYWWFLIVSIVLSFLLVGKLSANYILPNINLLSLFRNGKFLVLFQNNSEIRSSGGFIGSYAVVEVQDYEIKNIFFNTNIYALDREFARFHYIDPPPPLAKMLKGETWALRDANYDASFPEGSQDILRFYETETGDHVDGVIGINAKVIVDLLRITGPIKLDKYDLTISAQNFYQETQEQVEKNYWQLPENWVINEPKTFLKDLYPAVLTKALENKFALAGFLKNELAQKEIIFSFKDQTKQALIEKYNLAGKIYGTQELKDLFLTSDNVDYLYINSNSYSGNKSSISIKEDLVYKLTETFQYGQKMYKADLKISRIHSGSYDWPDGKNLEWLRVFVPQNAQFLEAKINGKDINSQVEVGSEAGKIYFGTEVVTEPDQANILEINYLVPYEEDYHLLVQKQPGRTDNLTVSLDDKMLFDGILDGDAEVSKN